jgi:hypothetical protein
MSDKPRTDWVSFSLGGLWAMEKDGGLLVPKCHPLSSSERAERLISYAAQGLGVPGFCIEMHPSGVWEVFVGPSATEEMNALLHHCNLFTAASGRVSRMMDPQCLETLKSVRRQPFRRV